MFSLLVIPFVFLFYATNYLKENDFRVLGIVFPEKDSFKKYPESNYKVGYKYDTVQVPVDFQKETEGQFFELIKQLQEKNVDKTGIKFQLTDKNTYGDFVRLNNLMLLTEQYVYAADLDDDGFYIIHLKKEIDNEEITPFYCGLHYHDDRSGFEIFKSDIKDFFQNLPNSAYPIIAGYLILVVISFFRPKIFIPIPFKTKHNF